MTFVRYVAVQLVAYAIDMGVFLAVLKTGIAGPVVANFPAKVAAGVFAFFVHRHFTFRLSRTDRGRAQVVQYFVLLALNVPLSSGVLSVILLVIGPPAAAKFVADVICVLFTFWVSKAWVFRSRNVQPRHSQTGGPP